MSDESWDAVASACEDCDEVKLLRSRLKRATVAARELRTILYMAWEHQMANVGSKHEFYKCYTYEHGNTPEWIERTRKALNKPRKVPHYKG